MKKIAILGSTGSIGQQALDVIARHPEEYEVSVLSCAKRIDELEKQIEKFKPEMVVAGDEGSARALEERHTGLRVAYGAEGLVEAASEPSDILLNALVGMRGLAPTLAACRLGKTIAFANKETLVCGGELVMAEAKKHGATLLPVDSEHSAIFQCLEGNPGREVRRILLTCSGGPFRGYTREQLRSVTPAQALKHPRWNMGAKITIDSATLMNKGLEIIEARWLFDVPEEKIEVLIHPQSIVHSAVEFRDRSVLAQMAQPDMRVPISYAFSYPRRLENADFSPLNFFDEAKCLTFEKPDTETFRGPELAREALRRGGTYPAAFNAANEELVQLFLDGRIGFLDIQDTVERILDEHVSVSKPGLEEILAADAAARDRVKGLFQG